MQNVEGDRKLLLEAPVVGGSREAEVGLPSFVEAHKAVEHKTVGSGSRISAGWNVLPQIHGSYSEFGEGGRISYRGNEQHFNLLTRRLIFSDLNLN